MKKHVIISVVIILTALIFSGCGVKQEEYDKLMAEKDTIVADYTTKVEALNDEVTSQKNRIEELESIIDELQNGEDRKFTEICNLYEASKYDEVITSSKSFHEKYNGSDKDAKVQELAKLSQAELDRIAEEKRIAEEAAAAEARKSAEEKAREIIRVSKVSVSSPDSAGGVALYINFKNNSDKTIKYVDFSVTMYNAVGDIDLGSYEDGSFVICRATGPYNKGQGISGTSEYWGKYYSYQIKRAELLSVTIEYMDGTRTTLSSDEVGYVQY